MLIAFSGLKGAGKDTAAAVLIKEYEFTKIAFADALREALLVLDPVIDFPTMWGTDTARLSQLVRQFGWDKLKREIPEVRRLMQVFGTEVGRMLFGENVWVDILAQRFPDIADPASRYVVTDCRFPNEVEFIHDKGGKVVWIDRSGLQSDGHASESTQLRELADVVIPNFHSLEVFKDQVRQEFEHWYGPSEALQRASRRAD